MQRHGNPVKSRFHRQQLLCISRRILTGIGLVFVLGALFRFSPFFGPIEALAAGAAISVPVHQTVTTTSTTPRTEYHYTLTRQNASSPLPAGGSGDQASFAINGIDASKDFSVLTSGSATEPFILFEHPGTYSYTLEADAVTDGSNVVSIDPATYQIDVYIQTVYDNEGTPSLQPQAVVVSDVTEGETPRKTDTIEFEHGYNMARVTLRTKLRMAAGGSRALPKAGIALYTDEGASEPLKDASGHPMVLSTDDEGNVTTLVPVDPAMEGEYVDYFLQETSTGTTPNVIANKAVLRMRVFKNGTVNILTMEEEPVADNTIFHDQKVTPPSPHQEDGGSDGSGSDGGNSAPNATAPAANKASNPIQKALNALGIGHTTTIDETADGQITDREYPDDDPRSVKNARRNGTGDESNLVLYGVVAGLSILALIVYLMRRRH